MRCFVNLSIRGKLFVGFGALLLFLTVVSVTAVVAMRQLLVAQERIQQIELNNVIDYQVLESNINENRTLLLRMMRTNDAAKLTTLQQEMSGIKEKSDEIMTRLLERVPNDPIPVDKLEALNQARGEFNRIRDAQIVPSIFKGASAEMEESFIRGTTQYQKVKDLCAELSDRARSDVRTAVGNSIVLVKRGERLLLAMVIMALLLTIAMIVCLHRAIALPLNQISQAAARIAEGDLSLILPTDLRQDEVGLLARSFESMQQSLREMAKVADRIADGDLAGRITPRSDKDTLAISFSIMAENLKGLVQEIRNGTRETEESMRELLELSKEVVTSTMDSDKAKQFQRVSLRMEEVTIKLNLLVQQIKL